VAQIAVVYAHPYPGRSVACRALVEAVKDMQGVAVRPIYSLYPDFDVDVAAEQAALDRAGLVVWLHPLYWYGVPGLMKHWLDVVLVKGWAYGEGGGALAGKDCLWVATTGGDARAYSPEGRHHHPLEAFVTPVEQTARYCGMHWLDPFIVHGAHEIGADALRTAGERLRERLALWQAGTR
jgi:glutathione-regulated potassium-efflux system ancillary protein KefF